ncbi:cytosine deaminase, partial [Pseudomonas sp. FW305-47B]
SVVMQTSLANIEAVMIGGVWEKRNGKLLIDGLERKKELLAQSGHRLVRGIERQGHAAH